jgi:methionyl aminopeptidase
MHVGQPAWKLFPLSARNSVPDHIMSIAPEYARQEAAVVGSTAINSDIESPVKTPEELELMRRPCRIASAARAFGGSLVRPGVTTDEIDRQVHEFIIGQGAYPSPLGYSGFPKSLCSSVNQVVVHGIPDLRPLEDGDIVNLDVSCYVDGFHGDCSATFLCGDVSPETKAFVVAAKTALQRGIECCAPGVPIGLIGEVISDYLDPLGYTVVSRFGGHGIGRNFHIPPFVYHVPNGDRTLMEPNMTFTIEPAIAMGSTEEIITLEDQWTVISADESLSAQFEETIAITEQGAEILTAH